MRKRELVWMTVVVAALVATIAVAATKAPATYPEYEMLVRIVDKILNEYVDPVERDKLFQAAYGGMVSSLDPYSQYMPPAANEELTIHTRGQYGGLGIEITISSDGFLTVVTPMEDTPAFRAGVMAGDKILKIDGKNVMAIPLSRRSNESVKMLRGKPGTDVTIHVAHEDGEREDITITRAIITTKSVRGGKIVDEDAGIGYIRLSQFQEGTAKEMDEFVNDLLNQGMRALIVDLRFNPGGLLGEANAVSDRFLSKGVIVSTRGRTPGSEQKFTAHAGNTYDDFPVAVLISQRSASGSEIVAGALQDHRRAVIVGTRSYGKGSVQTISQLPDGSGLRLTTARYYTPSGRNIHRNPYADDPDEDNAEWGISPDFDVPISRDEEVAIVRQWRDEHIIRENGREDDEEPEGDEDAPEGDADGLDDDDDAVPLPDAEGHEEKVKPFVDRQLDVAKTVLKAMLLAGGKEIRPERIKDAEAAAAQ